MDEQTKHYIEVAEKIVSNGGGCEFILDCEKDCFAAKRFSAGRYCALVSDEDSCRKLKRMAHAYIWDKRMEMLGMNEQEEQHA